LGIIAEHRLKEKFDHNILSVIYDTDSFFYVVSDLHDNLLSAVKFELGDNPAIEILDIINEENLSNHYYTAVNIYSSSDLFSFVPIDEYEYDKEEVFIKNSFDKEEHEISVNVCNKERLHIIHRLDKDLMESLDALIGEDTVKHFSLACIESISNNGLYVFLVNKKIIIHVRKKDEFVFYNHFKISTAKDILYFVMLVYQQLDLDLENHICYVSGINTTRAEHLLTNYIRNVMPLELNFKNLSKGLDVVDLYLASICE
jgi:hypothetical protein